MEYMSYLAFIFAICVASGLAALSSKVNRLERILKDANITENKDHSLRELLKRNLEKTVTLSFKEDYNDYDLVGRRCLILDVDSDWLFVETVEKEKKKGREKQKLIRIDTIKGVQFQ